MKRQLLMLALVAFVAVMLFGAASAATPTKSVSSVLSAKSNPAMDGSTVVWSDDRGTLNQIYMKNLKTGTNEKIVSPSTKGYQVTPDVSGKYVVWTEENIKTGATQIYYKDITSTSAAQMVQHSANVQINPKISNGIVVWQESVSGKYVIYGLNLKTNDPYQVSSSSYSQTNPDISGTNLVYRENNKVMYCDLLDPGNPITVFQHGAFSFNYLSGNPKISGSNIVYSSYNTLTGVKHITNYNVDKNKYTTVASSKLDLQNPSIALDNVVWQQYNTVTKKYDIMLGSITGTTPVVVSNYKYTKINPVISKVPKVGTFVAWVDYRTGSSNPTIMWRNMFTTPPKVLSTSPTNGQKGVSKYATVAIKFDNYLLSSTNFSKIEIRNENTDKYVAITKWIVNDVLYIKTNVAKAKNTLYTVIIPAKAISDLALDNLSKQVTFTFRTA